MWDTVRVETVKVEESQKWMVEVKAKFDERI